MALRRERGTCQSVVMIADRARPLKRFMILVQLHAVGPYSTALYSTNVRVELSEFCRVCTRMELRKDQEATITNPHF